jgi:predicted Zn-dependent peptidase
MGNLPMPKFMKLAEKHFSSFSARETKNIRVPQQPNYQPFNLVQSKDINQAHVLIGGLADSYQSKSRRAVVLLNNILGGPAMNSKLNLNIREKYGFAYSIESSYTSLVDTGIFSVYLGVAPKSLNKSIQLIHKELKKLRDNKLSDLQLHYAKKQLIGQIALNQEGSANNMLGLAKSWQLFEKIEDLETVYNKINALTADELLEAANRIFNDQQLSTLIYQPN